MKLDGLHIGHFRGIRDLTLHDLRDVNLLLGGNDTGKTSILEALTLFEKPDDLSSILRASRLRIQTRSAVSRLSYSLLDSFLHLFPFSDVPEKELSLTAFVEGQRNTLDIHGELSRIFRASEQKNSSALSDNDVQEDEAREMSAFEGALSFNGTIQAIEISEDSTYRLDSRKKQWLNNDYIAPGQHLAEIINRSVFYYKSWEYQTVELLQMIDPAIEGIKLVPSEQNISRMNQVIEHRKYGEIPLYTYGDGMKKILSIASILPNAKDGVLMIDEIETSLQASILSKVFEWLLNACKLYKIQLFITTHSLEAISTMTRCASEHPSELACYRLEKNDGYTKVRRYSEHMVDSMVNGSGLDVR